MIILYCYYRSAMNIVCIIRRLWSCCGLFAETLTRNNVAVGTEKKGKIRFQQFRREMINQPTGDGRTRVLGNCWVSCSGNVSSVARSWCCSETLALRIALKGSHINFVSLNDLRALEKERRGREKIKNYTSSRKAGKNVKL